MHSPNRVEEEREWLQIAVARRRAEESVRNLVLLHTAKDLDTSNRPLRDRLAAQHYQFSSTVSPLAIAAAQR